MRDEEYVYIQDLKEKKVTARSARHARKHCGRGGRVKFPSDYLTKKELKNMSGECKSYRLNDPMKWEEFKVMPKDLQFSYMKLIYDKYNPPVSYIADMMGCDRGNLSKYLITLGLPKKKAGRRDWDMRGFLKWAYDAPIEKVEEIPVVEEVSVEVEPEEVVVAREIEEETPFEDESFIVEEETSAAVVPALGNMTYEGTASEILRSIGLLLGDAKVVLSVKWDVVG